MTTPAPRLLCQVTWSGALTPAEKEAQLGLLLSAAPTLTPYRWGDTEPPDRDWTSDSTVAAASLPWLAWSTGRAPTTTAATLVDPLGVRTSRHTRLSVSVPADPDTARGLAAFVPAAAATRAVAYAHVHVVGAADLARPAAPNGVNTTAGGDGTPYLNVADAELDAPLPDLWWGTLLGPDLAAGREDALRALGPAGQEVGHGAWWLRASPDPWDAVTDAADLRARRDDVARRLARGLLWVPPAPARGAWTRATTGGPHAHVFTVGEEVLTPEWGTATVVAAVPVAVDLPDGPATTQRLALCDEHGHRHEVVAYYARLSTAARTAT